MPMILIANQEDTYRFSILCACHLEIHPIALVFVPGGLDLTFWFP